MDLPITNGQARKVAAWMRDHYGDELKATAGGTIFTPALLSAIVCQETAYSWFDKLDDLKPSEILARCVLDASGDYPGTQRSAFPRNTAAFRAKYGVELTALLIREANATRALRGYGPKQWVYKGYGLFQYDLQFITEDREFFERKLWYFMPDCLARVMRELKGKAKANGGDLWKTVKAYNGAGPLATRYANNVMAFLEVIKTV